MYLLEIKRVGMVSIESYYCIETGESDLIRIFNDYDGPEEAPPAKRRREGGTHLYDPGLLTGIEDM
jgi:hypothetical protein